MNSMDLPNDLSIKRLKSLSCICFALLSFQSNSYAQERQELVEYLESGYYAVVGAFGVKKNAINYAKAVSELGENATYALYPPRGLYYVQIGKYESYDKARVYALAARNKISLDSTWVFKALPFTLESGSVIGGDVDMDQGIGIEYEIVKDATTITKVAENGEADRNGIETGDQITKIEDEIISGSGLTRRDINERLLGVGGSEINITIMRDGKEVEYRLTRGEVGNLVEEGKLDFIIRNDTVYIVGIPDDAPSAYKVLSEGDIILAIDGVTLSGVGVSNNTVISRLNNEKEEFTMTVMRDGKKQKFTIKKSETAVAGIGIEFELRGGIAYITKVVAGSPAEEMGLKVGDEILAVDGSIVRGSNISEEELLADLNGSAGTSVDLTIVRDGVERIYTIVRGFAYASAYVDRGTGNRVISVDKLAIVQTLEGMKMYFNTYRRGNFKEVAGRIEVINPDRIQRFAFKEAHQVIGIPESINRSGDISLICEIFGFKKIQHDFNMKDPMKERSDPFLTYEDSILVVDFELKRLTAGDLVTMYNVYFFKDAAIMRPESKYELKQLLAMLKENDDYKISVQGHTNGNNAGPIIELEPGSTDYFSQQAKKKEGSGSAKKLSEKRAEVIRNYLITSGISGDRIESKGFGGRKSIYEKFDPLAYKNVRVEIQILAD